MTVLLCKNQPESSRRPYNIWTHRAARSWDTSDEFEILRSSVATLRSEGQLEMLQHKEVQRLTAERRHSRLAHMNTGRGKEDFYSLEWMSARVPNTASTMLTGDGAVGGHDEGKVRRRWRFLISRIGAQDNFIVADQDGDEQRVSHSILWRNTKISRGIDHVKFNLGG